MALQDLSIDQDRLKKVCKRYGVARLEAFGSFPRGDAETRSDLDILVTFKEGAHPGLEFVMLQEELAQLFGRSVDLLPRNSVEQSPNKYFRQFALQDTELIYESA